MKKKPIGWFYDDGKKFTRGHRHAEALRNKGIKTTAVYYNNCPDQWRYSAVFLIVLSLIIITIVDRSREHEETIIKANELAIKVDTNSKTIYSTNLVDRNECADVLYRLKINGYQLESGNKLIEKAIDVVIACDEKKLSNN